MNVVLKLEVFLSVEYVWLKECDQFFMAHPVLEDAPEAIQGQVLPVKKGPLKWRSEAKS